MKSGVQYVRGLWEIFTHLKARSIPRVIGRIVCGYLLGILESIIDSEPNGPVAHRPVFFLGAPRSGTTLAMQVITDVFDIGYISNLHCRYYGAPALAERLFGPTTGRARSDYTSVHGRTEGNYAPAECGDWWYRFFRRRPPYVTLREVDARKMARFRKSIASLIRAFDAPVLFKNPYASLRIQAIAKYVPEALFIVIHRDEIDNGHSLLEVRKKVHGDYASWWSMEPQAVEELKNLPAHQQVIEQVRHIHSTIKKDLMLSDVGPSRCFNLHYEALCGDPAGVMDQLQEFFEANGCQVGRLGAAPEPFDRRREVRIDSNLYAAMAQYVQQH